MERRASFAGSAEGVFDQEDLALRTEELAAFIEAATTTYHLERDGIVAVGFSNGANIAASLLLRAARTAARRRALQPDGPVRAGGAAAARWHAVFIGAGRTDPIAPPVQAERLAAMLREAGADVTLHWDAGGHTLTRAELAAAREWIMSCLTGGREDVKTPKSATAERRD